MNQTMLTSTLLAHIKAVRFALDSEFLRQSTTHLLHRRSGRTIHNMVLPVGTIYTDACLVNNALVNAPTKA